MARDDTTRRALEAAGEAARRAMAQPGCCMEGTGCEMPPCHCSRVGAAAAIAAFLRSPDMWSAILDDYEAVTRAVERAAKGEG